MALYKRGETWWLDVVAPDGKRVRVSTKTSNRQLADRFAAKLMTDMWTEHQLGVKADRPFSDVVDVFKREKENCKSFDTYDNQLEWWAEQFKDRSVQQITQELIIETIEGGRKTNEWSNATSNRYLAALRAALRLVCKKHRWIKHCPNFFMYDEPKGRTRWLRTEEISRLLSAAPDWMAPMISFSLATGLRQGNVLSLRWSQVDLAKRQVTFSGDEMKNGKDFALPLNDSAVEAIRSQIGKNDEFVFTRNGVRMTGMDSRAWQRVLEAARIDDLRWHDLRHTWATMMAQSGVPDGVLQSLGSWDTAEMVNRYRHHHTESMRPYINSLDQVLAAAQIRSQSANDAQRQPLLRAV